MNGRIWASVLLVALAACGSGNVAPGPPVATIDPAKNGALQFAVGSATVDYADPQTGLPGTPPTYGLNVVETFRQANGFSATLYDVATIDGPPGFVGDASSFAADNRTPTALSSTIANSLAGFGAFGYGFGAEDATALTPVFGPPIVPAFDVTQATSVGLLPATLPATGGPPAWPYASGGLPVMGQASRNAFTGYPMGFFTYVSRPSKLGGPIRQTLGTYTLDLTIPIGTAVEHVKASATLVHPNVLPIFAAPAARADPAHPGGLLVDVVVPPGLTQAFVEIGGGVINYTIAVPTNLPGPVRVVLPPQLGAPAVNSTAPTRSLVSGATYTVNAYGFDYDAFAASYPANTMQRPKIVGANGQADITISNATTLVYP